MKKWTMCMEHNVIVDQNKLNSDSRGIISVTQYSISRIKSKRRIIAIILSAAVAGFASPLVAGPNGGNVVGGTGTIEVGGNTTTIHQDSDLMAIDWDSYNVNVDERVHYIQPDASSISLNRILSNQGSQIQGQIDANGQVILVNPNGIVFGANATVNAGGLLASGLDIQPEDFMNQDFAFSALDNAEGKVINAGLLNAATGGSVSLLGKQVKNEGLIVANLGAVNLVAGQDAVVTFDSNGLMGVRVTGDLLQNELGMEEAVINSGDIQALGGQILLSARVSEDIFTQAVHIDDQARSVVVHDDGSFTLGGADVLNSGTLDVSSPSVNQVNNPESNPLGGPASGRIVAIGDSVRSSGKILANANSGNAVFVNGEQTAAGSIELSASTTTELLPGSVTTANAMESGVGGGIKLLGTNVGVLGTSHVEASGANGGGEILIGGDIKGQNAWVPNAEFAYVAEQASIKADGTKVGDGGKLITFAEDTTRIYGELSAQGGFEGGNGGFIETSGLAGFDIGSAPNARARASSGRGGEWLIDPFDITIGERREGDGPTIELVGYTYESSENASFVSVSNISLALRNGIDVTVETGPDENDDEPGNITLRDSLTVTGDMQRDVKLSFLADNEIILNADINADDNSRTFSIVLEAKTGNVTINEASSITTNGGDITIDSDNGSVTVKGSLITRGGNITVGILDPTDSSKNRFPSSINTASGTLDLSSSPTGGRLELYADGDIALGEISRSNQNAYISSIEARSTGGNITLNNGLDFDDTTTATLFLDAAKNIFINEVISDSDGDEEGDTLNVILVADEKVDLNSNIYTGHGNVIISGDEIDFEVDTSGSYVAINTDLANAGQEQEGNNSLGASVFLRSSSDLDLGSIVTNNDSFFDDGNGQLVFGESGTSLVDFAGEIDSACPKDGTACGNVWIQGRDSSESITVTQLDGTELDVHGDSTFTLGSNGNLTLNQSVDFTGALHIPSAKDVVIDTGGLHLGNVGSVDVINSLTVSSSNLDSNNFGSDEAPDYLPILVSGTTILDAEGADIELLSESNNFNELVILNADRVNIIDTDAIALGGQNSITSSFEIKAGGAITGVEDQPINASATTTFTAGGDITLDAQAHNFSRVHILAANDVSISDVDGIILGSIPSGNIQRIVLDGELTVTADGDVTVYGEGLTVSRIQTESGIVKVDAESLILNEIDSSGEIDIDVSGNFQLVANGSIIGTNVRVNGTNGKNTFTLDTGASITSTTRSIIFTADDGKDEFNISSSNGNITFDGGSGEDIFNINVTGLSGSIEGGGDTDTLNGPGGNITWEINDDSSGLIDEALEFSAIDVLVGKDGDDTFNVNSDYDGEIKGGNGENTFNFFAKVFMSVTGGEENDRFNIHQSGLDLVLVGGDGSDTLTASAGNNSWSVNTVGNNTLNTNIEFSGFDNLVGNSGIDEFSLSAVVSGYIDGGSSPEGAIDQIFVNDVGETFTLELGTTEKDISAGEENTAQAINIERVTNRSGNTDYILSASSGDNIWQIENFDPKKAIWELQETGCILEFVPCYVEVIEDLEGDISDGINDGTLMSDNPFVGAVQFVDFSNLQGGVDGDEFVYTRNEINPGAPAVPLVAAISAEYTNSQLDGTFNGGADPEGETSVDTVNMSQLLTVNVFLDKFSSIERLIGNDTNSTLTSSDDPNNDTIWENLEGSSGSIKETLEFEGFTTLIGGTGNDTFVIGSDLDLGIDAGGGAGNDTVDISNISNAVDIRIADLSEETFSVGIKNVESFIGNANSRFIAADTAEGEQNDWDISGDNAGRLNGTNRFENFGTIVGGSGVDKFIFSAQGSLGETEVQGGGGNDEISLAGLEGDYLWTVTALNTDDVTSTNNVDGNVAGLILNFQSFESLVGSTGDNTLTANYAVEARTWDTIVGSVNGLDGSLGDFTFTGMDSLVGDDAVDTFQVSATSMPGTLNGGVGGETDFLVISSQNAVELDITSGGTSSLGISSIENIRGTEKSPDNSTLLNTLVGFEANTWTINQLNGGSVLVDGAPISFTNFAILQGGSGTDAFTLQNTGSLSAGGYIDGIDGTDTLTIEASVGSIQGVVLADMDTVGSSVLQVLSVINIGEVNSSAEGLSLTGFNGTNTWNISNSNSNIVNSNIDENIAFSGFTNIEGGSGKDIFHLTNGGTVSGELRGNGGDDEFNLTLGNSLGGQTTTFIGGGTADLGDKINVSGGGTGVTTSSYSLDAGVDVNGNSLSQIEYSDESSSYTLRYFVEGNANIQDDVQADTLQINGTAESDTLRLEGNTFTVNDGVTVNYSNKNNLLIPESSIDSNDRLELAGTVNFEGGTVTLQDAILVQIADPVLQAKTLYLQNTQSIGTAEKRFHINVDDLHLSDIFSSIYLEETDSVNIAEMEVSGVFDLVAENDINSSASISTAQAAANFVSNSGSINLPLVSGVQQNSFIGPLTLDAALDVTLYNSAVSTKLVDVFAGRNFTINAEGLIDATGPVKVVGTTHITAGGNAEFMHADNDFMNTVELVIATRVDLFDENTLSLGVVGSVESGSEGALNSSGTLITSSQGLNINGEINLLSARLAAGAGVASVNELVNIGNGDLDITAQEIVQNADILGGGAVNLLADTDITMDSGVLTEGTNVTYSGNNLVLEALTGEDIVLTASDTINQNAQVEAISENIKIDAGTFIMGSNATLEAVGNITLDNSTAVTTELADVTAQGNFVINTQGGIEANGPVVVGGRTDITAGNDAEFLHEDNDFMGAVELVIATRIDLVDQNDLSLAAVAGSENLTGTLTTQSQGLDIKGEINLLSATFNAGAGTASLNAKVDIGLGDLNVSGQQIEQNANITGGAATMLSADTDIVMHSDASTQAVNVTYSGSNLSLEALTGETIRLIASDTINQNAQASAENIQIEAGTFILETNATLDAGSQFVINTEDAIDASGPVLVGGTTHISAGGDAWFLNENNDFMGAVEILSATSIDLFDINSLNLGWPEAGSTQEGAVNLSGTLTTFSSGLNIHGPVNVLSASLNARDGVALLDAILSVGDGGELDVTAQEIVQNAHIRGAGVIALSAVTDINMGSEALTQGASVTYSGDNLLLEAITGESIVLAASDTLTQNAQVRATSDNIQIDAGTFMMSANTRLDATEGNIRIISTGDAALQVSNAGGEIFVNAAAIDIQNSMTANTLMLTANEDITLDGEVEAQSSAELTSLTGDVNQLQHLTSQGEVSFNAQAGDITMSSAARTEGRGVDYTGDNLVLEAIVGDTVTLNARNRITQNAQLTPENAAALVQADALYLPGLASVGAADQRFNMDAGDLHISGINSGMYLQESGSVNIAEMATNSIFDLQAQNNITSNAALTAHGATTMVSTAGNVDLPKMTQGTQQNIFSGPLTLIAAGNITLHNSTTTALSGVNAGGNFDISAEGVIEASGPVVVGGTTQMSAGANAEFLHPENDFKNPVVVASATSIDLFDTNDLTLGAVTMSGSLTATANGDLNTQGLMGLSSAVLNAGGTTNVGSSVMANNRFEVNAAGIRVAASISADTIQLSGGDGEVTLNGIVSTKGGLGLDIAGGQIVQNADILGGGAINLTAATAIDQDGRIFGDDDVILVVQNGDITMGRDAFTEGVAVDYSANTLVLEKLEGESINLTALNTLTQNALVQATTENIQVEASAFVMGTNASLDATTGNITVLSSGNAELQASNAGGHIFVNADALIDIQDTMTANTIDLTANADITVNGALAARGNIDLRTATEDVIQQASISTDGAVTLIAQAGDVTMSSGASTQGGDVLYSGNNLSVAAVRGEKIAMMASDTLTQNAHVQATAENIQIDAGVFTMAANSSLDASVGNITITSTIGNAQLHATHAGEHLSVNANKVIDIQGVIEARTMGLIANEGIFLNGALVGEGNINMNTVTGAVNQLQNISTQGDVNLIAQSGDINMGLNALTQGAKVSYTGNNIALEALTGASIVLTASDTITQNAQVQATADDIQINAAAFIMEANANLLASGIPDTSGTPDASKPNVSGGNITIISRGDATLQAANAGGEISLNADEAIDIQGVMTANTMGITANTGITVNGALGALGSIHLQTASGDVDQLQPIAAQGDVTLNTPAGDIRMRNEALTEGASVNYAANNLTVTAVNGNHVVLNAVENIDQNGLVQAFTEDVQITANNYTMGENAKLGATVGSIIVNTLGNADIQAAQAGWQISINANNLINIQGETTANAITLVGQNGVNVNGALKAQGNIDLQSSSGDVNQNRGVSAQADLMISAANAVTVSAQAAGNNINIVSGELLTLDGNLNGQENISLSSRNGSIEQTGAVTTAAGNINMLAMRNSIDMQTDALLQADGGEINISAGENITVAQVNAGSEGTIIAKASNGEIIDGNTDALNFVGRRLEATAYSGIGHSQNLELSVAELSIGNFQNSVQIRSDRSVQVDQLLNNGGVWLTSSKGDFIFNNDHDRIYDRTQTDANLASGLLDGNYNVGDLLVFAEAGNIVGLGTPRTNAPDIVAKNATLWAPLGSVGLNGRPLVVHVREDVVIRAIVSYKPFWAFGTPPQNFDNESLEIDLTDVLGSGGDEMVEVEQLEDIDPAIFTNVRNFFYDEVSVRLPNDQLFEDELEAREEQGLTVL